MNAWLDAHEKTDLMRVDLDAKAREMKFEKISDILLNKLCMNSSNTVENSCVTLTRYYVIQDIIRVKIQFTLLENYPTIWRMRKQSVAGLLFETVDKKSAEVSCVIAN